MSYSRTFVTDLEKRADLAALLEEMLAGIQGSTTLEQETQLEGALIQLLDMDHNRYILRNIDTPNEETYREFYEWVHRELRALRLYQDGMRAVHLEQQSVLSTARSLLGAKAQRLRSKIAELDADDGLWKYITTNSLKTDDFIDSQSTTLSVWPDEGVATLPHVSETSVAPASVKILAGSNGVPGNSDTAITTNNINIENLLLPGEERFFEYERLDDGPLYLSIRFGFEGVGFVNAIELQPVGSLQLIGVEINGVPAVGAPMPDETAEDFIYRFMPVIPEEITLKFMDTVAEDVEINAVLRDRYSVAIANVKFLAVQYAASGKLQSNELNYPQGLYAVRQSYLAAPSDEHDLHQISMRSSADPNGRAGSYSYVVDVQRNDSTVVAAAADIAAGLVENRNVYTPEVISTPVSRVVSPIRLELDNADPTSVYVYRPMAMAFGNDDERLEIGRGFNTAAGFPLPYRILDYGVVPSEVQVFLNGLELERVESSADVSAGYWAFSDNYNKVILNDDFSPDDILEMVIEPESMDFHKKADGFYHYTRMPLDPDIGTLSVRQLPDRTKIKTVRLRRGQTVHSLGVQYVEKVRFSPTALTQVTDRDDLSTTANSYYLDAVDGILYLSAAVTDVNSFVWVHHKTPEPIAVEDIDIVWEEGKAVGVRVKNLSTDEITETVSDALLSRFNPGTGVLAARATIINGVNARQLSHEKPLRGTLSVSSDLFTAGHTPQELPYIDGRTEFLGLVEMSEEYTTAITAGAGNTVSFNLSAGAFYYSGEPPVFSDTTTFATQVDAAASVDQTGEWHVSPSGTVTVFIANGSSLPAGIQILYRYVDPEFSPDGKYSVDYSLGILYGSSEINSSAEITYQVAEAFMHYQAVIPQERWSLSNNLLEIHVPFLAWRTSANRLIKVAYTERAVASQLDIAKYYTPFISQLQHLWS